MLTHPSEQLWSEVVRIGYNLHWPLDDALDLEHPARQRVLSEIDRLHRLHGLGSTGVASPRAPGADG